MWQCPKCFDLIRLRILILFLHRLSKLIPNLRIVEAHGQHTDLEDRIDYFSSGQVRRTLDLRFWILA
jgi:hypothetical protein